MRRGNRFREVRSWLTLCIGLTMMMGAGCDWMRWGSPETPSLPHIGKVVLVGFRPAIPEYGRPEVVRSPVTGTVFMAEPVSPEIARNLTQALLDRMQSKGPYELVPPGQALGVYSTLIDSDAGANLGAIEVFQEVGKAFQADGVMAGYLYRWREREGGNYAVNRPASVAFDLYVIRPGDGALLWKAKFDKTQRSLSENVLDLNTFMEGRGQWMEVEELAMMGLEEMLKGLPRSGSGSVGVSRGQTEE